MNLDWLAAMIRQHHLDLVGYVISLKVDYQDAESVAQNVWIRVWKYLDRYDDDRPFKPWLYGCARNEVRTFFRDQQRYRQRVNHFTKNAHLIHMLSEFTEYPEDEDDILDRIVAESGYVMSIVNSIIDLLPKTQRKRMRKHYIEGMTYEEIAAEEGVSKGSIGSCMFKAHRNFQNKWTLMLGEDFLQEFVWA